MNTTKIIITVLVVALVLWGLWYFMSQPETGEPVSETEGMMADDGTLTEDELDDDMIEAEIGGEFEGIIRE